MLVALWSTTEHVYLSTVVKSTVRMEFYMRNVSSSVLCPCSLELWSLLLGFLSQFGYKEARPSKEK